MASPSATASESDALAARFAAEYQRLAARMVAEHFYLVAVRAAVGADVTQADLDEMLLRAIEADRG